MSPYIIVLGLLCLGAYDEGFIRRRSSNRIYSFLFMILTLMLCLRYGQGTDYLGYKHTYVHMPVYKSLSALLKSSVHGEPGWKFICMVCHNFLKLPFEWFVGIISVFESHPVSVGNYKVSVLGLIFAFLVFGFVISIFS